MDIRVHRTNKRNSLTPRTFEILGPEVRGTTYYMVVSGAGRYKNWEYLSFWG